MYGKNDTDIGSVASISASRYIGKVCERHPELKGERRKVGYKCVGCVAENRRVYKAQPEVQARMALEAARKREFAKDGICRARMQNALIRKTAGDIAITHQDVRWQPYYQQAVDQLRAKGLIADVYLSK